MRRRSDLRALRWAILVSAAVHGVAALPFWYLYANREDAPRMRVYSVNIVSPPPRELGEWSPAPTGEPAAEAPEPEPDAPAPEPEPEPEPVAPKEPSPAPKATTRTPPRETPKAPTPAPKETPKAPTPAPKETPKSSASTGARPDPNSPGGEDIDVRSEGARFVEPGYLENIVRQINRYFRRPTGSVTDEAEIAFWINRDGSVSDIEVVRATGSFRFRAAAMEAVEQAGNRKAFGPLPRQYPADRLQVSFYFRPSR